MSDYSAILQQLYEILASYIKADNLTEDSMLVAEYGMTSLQVMQMIADVEDSFDVSVPLNVLPDIVTVGDLARQVESLLDG